MKTGHHQELKISVGGAQLPALLDRPASSMGLILFVHGSGSSRLSPRNRNVAKQLNECGMATLLFDLLTANEHEQDRIDGRFRFDIDLLSARLLAVLDWLRREATLAGLPIGLFGASTGAAAALIAAAERPRQVRAVVSRGGRVDLAGEALARVRAPILMIIGSLDREIYRLSRAATRQITTVYELRLIANASHLFEEAGKLDEVAQAAAAWFQRYLAEPRIQPGSKQPSSDTEQEGTAR